MKAEVSREDQVVAALCHMSILMPMFGALVPLLVWLTQRHRSLWLRFQALQAAIYQGAAVLVYFGLSALQVVPMLIVMALVFAMLLFSAASSGPGPSAPPDDALGVMALVAVVPAYILSMVMALLQCISAPAFAIVGVWATWRTLKGRRFRYPLIGSWVARRTQPAPPAIANPQPDPPGG